MEQIVENTLIKLDNKDRAYATGKRKNSIARVWLKKGDGKISVNGKSIENYLEADIEKINILFISIKHQELFIIKEKKIIKKFKISSSKYGKDIKLY